MAKPGAPIYGPSEAVRDFGGRAVLAEAGKAYTAAGFSFRAVPAYNLSKSYHPKASGWVGYVLLVDGDSYYFAGDTKFEFASPLARPLLICYLWLGGVPKWHKERSFFLRMRQRT